MGDYVSYSSIYTSSDSQEALKPAISEGTVTKVIPGARNPYLINDGTGWVNDEAINNASEAQEEKIYTVQSGDSLWSIAERLYGDGSRYTELAEKNNIENAAVIYAGQEIRY